MIATDGKYSTAEARWSGVGPYYAMFPASFATDVILNYTSNNEVVFDPFAGRGTAVYGAATNDRVGVGIEINPVGWVYTKTKLDPAEQWDVEHRLQAIVKNAYRYRRAAKRLPLFFKRCFTIDIRAFLLTARSWLNWRQCKVDRTLMALLLVHLHGKRTDSFSNQMRQTKSMSPPYAINWWQENNQCPPNVDPLEFMLKKIKWRYAKGTPTITSSAVFMGDSVHRIGYAGKRAEQIADSKVRLLLTSPPYCGVTNYHYDQWLRLWLLGSTPHPAAAVDSRRGKFVNRAHYRDMLYQVFKGAANLLDDEATVYVRTDHRKLTWDITTEVLKTVFPEMAIEQIVRDSPEKTQTDLFANEPLERGEVDIILRR